MNKTQRVVSKKQNEVSVVLRAPWSAVRRVRTIF
jgi:hypothetical protein